MVYRVNAGRLPKDHWTYDEHVGGGRIIGEVCHFVDLLQFFAGAPPVSVFAMAVTGKTDQIIDADSVVITVRFGDGSNGCIAYLSEGDRGLAKERVELFGGGKSFVIDDFRRGSKYKDGREEQISLKEQDKGQQQQVKAVCASILEGTPAPINLAEIVATTRATFRIVDSLREQKAFEIGDCQLPIAD